MRRSCPYRFALEREKVHTVTLTSVLLPATAAFAIAVVLVTVVRLCHRVSVAAAAGACRRCPWLVVGDRWPLLPSSLAVGGFGLVCSAGDYGYSLL